MYNLNVGVVIMNIIKNLTKTLKQRSINNKNQKKYKTKNLYVAQISVVEKVNYKNVYNIDYDCKPIINVAIVTKLNRNGENDYFYKHLASGKIYNEVVWGNTITVGHHGITDVQTFDGFIANIQNFTNKPTITYKEIIEIENQFNQSLNTEKINNNQFEENGLGIM